MLQFCIPFPRGSHRSCSVKNDVVKNWEIGKFHTKTPVLEFIFNKVLRLKVLTLFKKTPTQMFS